MNKNLIVIDDDEQFAGLLKQIASTAGFDTDVCHDARDYFNSNKSYDVMVLDLNMPAMDGVEVIRQLGKASHQIHLILVSGYDLSVVNAAEKLANEHALNVVGSLTKPLKVTEFINMLSAIDISRQAGVSEIKTAHESITADEILHAIRAQELVLFYQPQIELKTKKIKGVEALVRWQHPVRGLIAPGLFIGIAEEQGLMAELTASVISMAVKQSNEWKKAGHEMTISVNVSAENITSLSLPEQLEKQIKDHDLDPRSIILEITESALMGELKTSLDILTRLRMKGFSLSIDDFGTGNSSLVLLHRIPFTELKIDMSFVRYMDQDVDAFAIVETCVMLAHKLKMNVVAEGIENQTIQEMLTAMGCTMGQGFAIAKPMPAEQLSEWMHSHL